MKEKYIIIALLLTGIPSIGYSETIDNTEQNQSNNDWHLNFNSTALIPQTQDSESNNLVAPNKSNNDNGYSFSASLGYTPDESEELFHNTRFETEISFRNSDIQGNSLEGKVSTVGVIENAFYDFNNASNIKPYIGAGAGVANISVEGRENLGTQSDASFTLPAYQAMAGVSYQSQEHPSASIHMGYKYFTTIGKAVLQNIDPASRDATSHNFEAGVKVDF